MNLMRPTCHDLLIFGAPLILEEDIQDVIDTVRLGRISAGSKVQRFEEECRHLMEGCHVIAVNSCTAALFLALKIIGDYTAFHLRRFYREKYGYQQGDFPNAEWISDCMLPLPLTAKMTPGDAEYVVEVIQFILTQQGR